MIQKISTNVLLALAMALGMATVAMAGTGGTEFDPIYVSLGDWLSGTLGRILALGMLGVSAFLAFIKPNFIGALAALGLCLILANSVTIIDALLAATL